MVKVTVESVLAQKLGEPPHTFLVFRRVVSINNEHLMLRLRSGHFCRCERFYHRT